MSVIKVYFDGGAFPNPGKAYGSYEVVGEGCNHKISRMQHGDFLTNNQAEYMTMIAALKWITHNVPDYKERRIEIYSDSKMLVMQMRRKWKVKVAHILELVKQAQSMLYAHHLDGRLRVEWRGRHENVERFGH